MGQWLRVGRDQRFLADVIMRLSHLNKVVTSLPLEFWYLAEGFLQKAWPGTMLNWALPSPSWLTPKWLSPCPQGRDGLDPGNNLTQFHGYF